MKGDFSRKSFKKERNYSGVLKQQGRVSLDSDANELNDIVDYQRQSRTRDVIGHCGVPKKGGGFKISAHSYLNDVVFPSAAQGWTVGNDANILFTADGGTTWESAVLPTGVSVNLWSVSFPTPENGWVAGDDATILHIQINQENGETTVVKQSLPPDLTVRLFSVSFVREDADNGWAAGDHATIVSTNNGGEDWIQQSVPEGVTAHLKDIYFISDVIGWAVGNDATILNTSDGGQTWQEQSAPSNVTECLRSVYFSSANDGWIVGDNGAILHTTDGGQNWIQQTTSVIDQNLKDVYFETKEKGWIVGDNGTILFTQNEGGDWINQSLTGISAALHAISFDSTGLGCIVGDGGTILTKGEGDNSWNPQSLPEDFRISIIATDGRIYVDGLLCEPDRNTSYFNQPNYPNPPETDKEDGQTDLVYIDVWERHITAIEDPEIREVALRGPDTTTRVKTIYQIKIESNVGEEDCLKDLAGWPPATGKGCLTTSAEEDSTSDEPCIIAPGGGYRGLENQLYRVEIHQDGNLNEATFKWSRDNGSVVYAIENFESGDPNKIRIKHLGKDQLLALKKGDWVEVSGDETELKGQPGTFAQIDDIKEAQKIIILSADVSVHNHETHPKLRRWDQGSDVIPVTSDPIKLEKGIEIRFSGENFKTGDYWVFAARTATADVERLVDAPPMGIKHHYCKLALITWHERNHGKWRAEVRDCRSDFPSLTEICAEDICFDNSECDFVDTETVQDAIDRLCRSNNLRHHNKHLHGWGIVCGLQVHCGTEDEDGIKTVKVRKGYAIDCNGNDLLIKRDEIVRIMEMIPDNLLSEGNDGEVCLTLGLDENNQLVFNVEEYDPSGKSHSWRGGALLNNIYSNCIEPLVEFFKKEITGNGGEKKLVGLHQKRLTVLLNLVIQYLNPEYGNKVYLSPQEDEILENLYNEIKELLRSKTFCAMFENIQQFPDYPDEFDVSTIFGKGFRHTRLRIDHQSKRAYTIGGMDSPAGSHKIHVYDLGTEKMVAELEFPGGEGIKVQDVAFSDEGDKLYAVAILNDEDSIFAVADIIDATELSYQWNPISTHCDIELVTLATAPGISNNVYAIGKGIGLFVIDPNNIEPGLVPAVIFDAAGHLVIDEQGARAYATNRENLNDPLKYNQVTGMYLEELGSPTQSFIMMGPNGIPLTGEDDIEIATHGNSRRLCVVANALPGSNTESKQLLLYNITDQGSGQQYPDYVVDLGENTDIRLEYNRVTNYLMAAYEDSYRVRIVDIFNIENPHMVDTYHHPVQIFPQGIAMDNSSDIPKTYVFNWISNTINPIPADRFKPDYIFPLDPLINYRNDVFEAFADLLGRFFQYLKDCICDQFLINCPECDEEDKIYLACISIRDNQIYKVCNFSKRKYIKSFPVLDYWLSFIPVAPIIRKIFEKACCTVLPSLFSNFTTGDSSGTGTRVKGSQVKWGYASYQNFNIKGQFTERKDHVNTIQALAKDWMGNLSMKQVAKPEKKVKQSAMVGKSLDEVKRKLSRANITVEKVETYDPVKGPRNLRKFTVAPTRLKENSRVILYEQNGKVRYYALAEKEPMQVEELRNKVEAQETKLEEVKGLQEEVVNLKTQMTQVQGEHQKAIDARNKEITNLKNTVEQFKKNIVDIESLKKQVDQLTPRKKPTKPRRGGGE